MQHNEQASPTPVAGVDVAAIRETLLEQTHFTPDNKPCPCHGCSVFSQAVNALDALTRAQAEQRGLIADAARALLCGPVDPELTAAEYLRQALREVPAKWKERALLIEERDALKAEVARLTQALQQAQPSPVAEQGQE